MALRVAHSPILQDITLFDETGVAIVNGMDRGRVARPLGFALTDPGRRLSRTRLLLEVTRVDPSLVSRDE
jgi:hypothetical protein